MDNGHTVHPGIWEIVWSETIIIFFFKENYGFYFFSVKLTGVFEGAHRILFVGIREGHYVDVCSGELRRMIIESDDKN